MATISEPAVKMVEGERRFVMPAVGWEGYQALLKMIGNRSIRLTYDRGSVELMSPPIVHERYGNRLGYMIEALTDELEIPRIGGGRRHSAARISTRVLNPMNVTTSPISTRSSGNGVSIWPSIHPPTWRSKSRSPGAC